MASNIKHKRTTLERIEKALSATYFSDVNIWSKLYDKDLSRNITLYHVVNLENPPAGTKPNPSDLLFENINVGDSFGPTWHVHWFKLAVSVPPTFYGKEVHLRWDSPAECMLFNDAMEPLQGFSGTPDHQRRCEFVLSRNWEEDEEKMMTFYVEMQCCDMFGAGQGGMIEPPDDNRKYPIRTASVTVFNRQFYDLFRDLELLYDYAKLYGDDDTDDKGYQALYTGNDMLNRIHYGDLGGAQQLADKFFSEGNGRKSHTIHAVGHCHIDSAWLWSYDVTKRKCARSWMSTIKLMEEYDHFTFVCSQAQQLQWIKELYPGVFEKIKQFAELGRFIPVGGAWVEMDGNIPSGESFVRQFLYGQKFFEEEFGIRCKEFWLPDTFGYSAQIPQILQHVGITRFLTQKLSWSLVNKFPHHNFFWEGIDGSAVLVHFPPGDSYEANCRVSEALKTVRNLKDKGRVKDSMMLFGYGDGGGGPTRQMIERLHRLRDVDGVPKMESSTPDIFFSKLEESGEKLCRWKGELYLELHNGTYTSQAAMKELNRRCEAALQNSEFLVAVASLTNAIDRSTASQLCDRLEKAWKDVLLNQFHDVLPGSSIKHAHDDAEALFHSALSTCKEVTIQCLDALKKAEGATFAIANSLQWTRTFEIQARKFLVPGFGLAFGYLNELEESQGIAPSTRGPDTAEVVAEDGELRRFILSSLNKVAKANFNKHAENLSQRVMNNQDRVRLLARMIHKKALSDALYRKLYAKLVRFLHDKNRKDHLAKEVVTLVLNSFDEAMKQENNSADSVERRNEELVLLANVDFMCELFLEQLISRRKMSNILRQACEKAAESHLALEIACASLSSVGATLAGQRAKRDSTVRVEGLYPVEEAISSLQNGVMNASLPQRLRFLVIEVLELHANSWKSRSEREGVQMSVKLNRSNIDGIKDHVDAAPVDETPRAGVQVRQEGDDFVIENRDLRARIDKVGRIVSLQHASSPFEYVKKGASMNQLVTFQDIPLFWDAWDCMDYHLETRKALNTQEVDVADVTVVESTEIRVSLRWSMVWNQGTDRECRLTQDVILGAEKDYLEFVTSVDWHENRTFLKVEFPSCLNVDEAVYEIQHGQLRRPTHVNTSWDWARFEVCGHRWAALAESNLGFAVLNDSKYGWSARGGTLTLSLLRSPKSPDKFCDMREHTFRYALKPFVGSLENSRVIQRAKEFNCGLLGLENLPPSLKNLTLPLKTNHFFTIETNQLAPTVVLDTVKLPERTRANSAEPIGIVIRLYEGHGVRALARVSTTLPVTMWQLCNGLEDPLSETMLLEEDGEEHYFEVEFGPFQIRSFLLY